MAGSNPTISTKQPLGLGLETAQLASKDLLVFGSKLVWRNARYWDVGDAETAQARWEQRHSL